jgi:hypothetical protein
MTTRPALGSEKMVMYELTDHGRALLGTVAAEEARP